MLFKTRKTVPPKMGKQPEIVKTDLKGFVHKKFHGPRTYITYYTISPNIVAVSLLFYPIWPVAQKKKIKKSHRRCPTTIYQPGLWGIRLGGFTSCYGGPATRGDTVDPMDPRYMPLPMSVLTFVICILWSRFESKPLVGWFVETQRWDPADREIKVG